MDQRQRCRRVVEKSVRAGLAHVTIDALSLDIAAGPGTAFEYDEINVGGALPDRPGDQESRYTGANHNNAFAVARHATSVRPRREHVQRERVEERIPPPGPPAPL